MTPMQALKPQFDQLKQLLPDCFKETALNKSEDRTQVTYFCGGRSVHEMKGVRSDFIKTFKAQFNDHDSYSIGFSFSYLELPPEQQTVQVSLKIGNREPSFLVGAHLGLTDFKEVFQQAIKNIDALVEKDYASVVEVFKQDFHLAAPQPRKRKRVK